MARTSDSAFPLWPLSTPLIWVLGIPHFIPLLGVYVLLGGKEHGFVLMAGALAVTGCFAGLIQSLIVGPRALLITPLSFFLGYFPGPYLIFERRGSANVDFNMVMLITFLSSIFCVMAGQLLLGHRKDRSPVGRSGREQSGSEGR
jgi:hypothetical protein